ncbi:portal protein [Gordonia phage Bunker]|nr:portal protein [Gordonia phage Bunker]
MSMATAEDRPSAAPATSERGYVLDSMNPLLTDFGYWDQFEQIPELIWPRSVGVFTRMASEDGRIASVMEAIKLPILRTQWRIDPNGAKKKVTKFVAANMGLPIVGADERAPLIRTRGRFLWVEHLHHALAMLDFGHSIFEQVYRLTDEGLYELRKLAPRPQDSIAAFHVARDGGLISIEQYPPGIAGADPSIGATIPIERLVAYVRNPRPGQWIGRSMLRPAYKHWLAKDELMRIEIATARRNGMGVPVATSTEKERDDKKAIDAYAELASKYRVGARAGVGLPYGAKLQLLGVEGNLPDLRRAIEYHDKQMALAGLAHFLNLDKGGSYSLASVLNDTFVQSVQTIAETIRATAQAHVIEDLVDVNWGPDEPAPLLVFDEIGSRQDATAAALQMLIAAGVLTPDPTLEAFERQQLGLPVADEPDEDDAADPADDPDVEPTDDEDDGSAAAPANARSAPRRLARASAGRRPITIETNGALTLW